MKWLEKIDKTKIVKYIEKFYGTFDSEYGFKKSTCEIAPQGCYEIKYTSANDFGDIKYKNTAYVTDFGIVKEMECYFLCLDVLNKPACFAWLNLAKKSNTDENGNDIILNGKTYAAEYLAEYKKQAEELLVVKYALAKLEYRKAINDAKIELKENMETVSLLNTQIKTTAKEIKQSGEALNHAEEIL